MGLIGLIGLSGHSGSALGGAFGGLGGPFISLGFQGLTFPHTLRVVGLLFPVVLMGRAAL